MGSYYIYIKKCQRREPSQSPSPTRLNHINHSRSSRLSMDQSKSQTCSQPTSLKDSRSAADSASILESPMPSLPLETLSAVECASHATRCAAHPSSREWNTIAPTAVTSSLLLISQSSQDAHPSFLTGLEPSHTLRNSEPNSETDHVMDHLVMRN